MRTPTARVLIRLLPAAVLCTAGPVSAEDVSPPAILQWFESTYSAQENRLADLFEVGYGSVWIPPTHIADSGGLSVGYDVRDRFDLGSPGAQTLYGTESGLRNFTGQVHRLGGSVYADYILNHNGFADSSSPGFIEAGGYPGFFLQDPDGGTDPFGVPGTDGDFHSRFEVGDPDLVGRLAGLIDIDHTTNHFAIRTPVNDGDPLNIPAGTVANIPDPGNARFYPDRDQQPIIVFNPETGQGGIEIYPFNTADPTAGDAVAENAMGLLMRNVQWMLQDVGVDGFRLDAARHFDPFVYDFFDQAAYRAITRMNLDGSPIHAFSFAEAAVGTTGELFQDHIKKTIDPNDIGRVGANRDALDFVLFRAITNNLQANALGNDWRNVVNAGADHDDDGLINGSSGVQFVQSHDDSPFETGLAMGNVAHAYILMRPGNAVVYYNALEHGDNRDFPDDGRGDALGNFGGGVATLVGLRNTHGRGDYRNRLTEKETHIYERSGSALVVLSNRNDGGFDQRRVDIDLPWGTPLIELTGNAANESDIPEIVIVDDDFFEGPTKATVRALRNDGQDKGYLVYGVANPRSAGGLQFTNVSQVIGPDTVPLTIDTDEDEIPDAPSNADIGRARLADILVIQDTSFTVSLVTDPVTLSGGWLNPATNQIENINVRDRDADGDFGVLKINDGLDLNGNGVVDTVTPGSVTYGFEEFDTANPGFDDPNGDGFYEQTIDTTQLSEGRNYVTARVFRHRDPSTGGDGGPAVFSDFKQTVYVDLLPPEAEYDSQVPFSADGHDIDFRVRSTDGTADNMHFFLDLPADLTDQEIVALVGGGSNANQIDRDLFQRGYFDVTAGNHTITVVAFELTGTSNVQRLAGISVDNGNGLGVGDVNADGVYSPEDLENAPLNFETYLYAQDALFNAAADVNGDGLNNNLDLYALGEVLANGGADQATLDTYQTILLRRGNINGGPTTDTTDIDSLYQQLGVFTWQNDLNVDGVVDEADVDTLIEEVLGILPGDFELDGDVDDADYALAFAGFTGPNGSSQQVPWSSGNLDGDNDVDDADYALAFANFTGPGSAANVPEPAALLTLVVAGGLAASRRRRA